MLLAMTLLKDWWEMTLLAQHRTRDYASLRDNNIRR